MKLGARGVAHVERLNRVLLKEDDRYSNLLLINLTASPLSWFMEYKDQNNRSAVLLSYQFLPSMAAKKLRNAADKVRALLGNYDAIHVRRGDKIKTRNDRFGTECILIWTGIHVQSSSCIESRSGCPTWANPFHCIE